MENQESLRQAAPASGGDLKHPPVPQPELAAKPEVDMATRVQIEGTVTLIKEDLGKLKGLADDFIKKRKETLTSRVASPYLNTKTRVILLPEYVFKEDSYLGSMIANLAISLDYEVHSYKSSRNFNDMTKSIEDFIIGMSCGPYCEGYLTMQGSEDNVENGRKFFRAQQIIHAFGNDHFLTPEALKKNHRFFKNNPEETVTLGKRRVPVESYRDIFASIFPEADRDKATEVILGLIRAYPLPKMIANKTVVDNILPVSEFIALNFSRTITVGESAGRRSKITRERVPGKPRQSPLLLKEEQEIIMDYFNSLFVTPTFLQKQEEFVKEIYKRTFMGLKAHVGTMYTRRADFLSKFAALTNKRLIQERNFLRKSSIRKKDIGHQDVLDLLWSRKNLTSHLATEILSLSSAANCFKEQLAASYEKEHGTKTTPAILIEILRNEIENSTSLPEVYRAAIQRDAEAAAEEKEEQRRPKPQAAPTMEPTDTPQGRAAGKAKKTRG
jgi:hypothetical protein